jgi:hypothetical protein
MNKRYLLVSVSDPDFYYHDSGIATCGWRGREKTSYRVMLFSLRSSKVSQDAGGSVDASWIEEEEL